MLRKPAASSRKCRRDESPAFWSGAATARCSSPSARNRRGRCQIADFRLQIGDVKAWIRERSPVTVAAFMDAALYHPEFGYYARAVQRSGRAGDFFTSVDVGPLFGELLARQIGEMHEILNSEFRIQNFDVVEAGAGNGRLSADILRALKRDAPETYVATRV